MHKKMKPLNTSQISGEGNNAKFVQFRSGWRGQGATVSQVQWRNRYTWTMEPNTVLDKPSHGISSETTNGAPG